MDGGEGYRWLSKTNDKAEGAGASSSLTLSSEKLPLKGRAEPGCRRQLGWNPKVPLCVGDSHRWPIGPRSGNSGVTGGGSGGGAWPRCGAARNPLWRLRGSVSIPERRRSWNRVPGPAAEEPFRGINTPIGWRSRVPRQSRACDCSAATAAEAGAGGGVSRVETPGLGAAEALGLLPCGCLPVRDRGSPSSLIALLWLWDTQSGLSFSLPGTPCFLRRRSVAPE